MSRIACFYCLYSGGSSYPHLSENLRHFHDILGHCEKDEYYEAGAVWSEDFRYSDFTPSRRSAAIDPGLSRDTDGICRSLILTYLSIANSIHRGEFDEYHIAFLLADPDLWDDEIESICRKFSVFLGSPAVIEFHFLYPNESSDYRSPFEEFMTENRMYHGDFAQFIETVQAKDSPDAGE